jgi:hypothetical protein
MRIDGYKMNAREAADEFARTAFDEPRKVGRWRTREHGHISHYADFQLIGGTRWYEVWLLANHSGWNIEVAEEGATI